MIAFLLPMPVGNAVRCILQPPAGATASKVLRKVGGAPSAHDDVDAVVVATDETAFIDGLGLVNGVLQFYRPFYLVEAAWVAGDVETATAAATLEGQGPDALEIVRNRVELGLKAEVQAGRIKHEHDHIPTFNAPPIFEDTIFPIVTVHLANQTRFASGLGEQIGNDVLIEGDWVESEGVLWRVQLTIMAWVVGNPDVRIKLRKAISAILLANLPVFSAAGLSEVEFSVQDQEDFETYNAPVYQAPFTFTCIAPQAVENRSDPISDVSVEAVAA